MPAQDRTGLLSAGSPSRSQRQQANGPNGEGEGWLMVKLAADKKQGGA